MATQPRRVERLGRIRRGIGCGHVGKSLKPLSVRVDFVELKYQVACQGILLADDAIDSSLQITERAS